MGFGFASRPPHRHWALLLFTFTAIACGRQPTPGDGCSDEGKLTCIRPDNCAPNSATACGNGVLGVECRGGTYARVDCRGTTGCTQLENDAMCDSSLAVAGDGCWTAKYEGRSQCDPRLADRKLVCTGGTWLSQPCVGCVPQGSPATACP